MNLIEKLGLEKCRQIVDGAPEWALSHCAKAQDYFVIVASDFDCCSNLSDLSTALADHDRIDACSDIKNHISPNTKVIEHE